MAEDINEEVRQEWKEDTDAFDRVRTVLRQTTRPKSAADIADIADTSPKTARKYLDKLVELGVAETVEINNGKLYRRDSTWYLKQEIERLLTNHSMEDIEDGIRRMRRELQNYRQEYNCESPNNLLANLEPDDDRNVWMDVSEWRTTERNLDIAQAAINFKQATEKISREETQGDPLTEV